MPGIVNDCLKEPSSVWRLPDTITTRSRHTVTDQGGAPRPSSSLRSCSPSAVTGPTLSTRGAPTDATHGRAVAHGCVHRSTSLGCLRLCRTRKSLNLAFCFDQLSSDLATPSNIPVEIVAPDRENPRKGKQSPWIGPHPFRWTVCSLSFRLFALI